MRVLVPQCGTCHRGCGLAMSPAPNISTGSASPPLRRQRAGDARVTTAESRASTHRGGRLACCCNAACSGQRCPAPADPRPPPHLEMRGRMGQGGRRGLCDRTHTVAAPSHRSLPAAMPFLSSVAYPRRPGEAHRVSRTRTCTYEQRRPPASDRFTRLRTHARTPQFVSHVGSGGRPVKQLHCLYRKGPKRAAPRGGAGGSHTVLIPPPINPRPLHRHAPHIIPCTSTTLVSRAGPALLHARSIAAYK